MCHLDKSALRDNPGMVLFNLVFGASEDEWFDAQMIYEQLLQYDIEEYSVPQINRLLKDWSSNGRLDRRFSQYRISPRKNTIGQYYERGFALAQ